MSITHRLGTNKCLMLLYYYLHTRAYLDHQNAYEVSLASVFYKQRH